MRLYEIDAGEKHSIPDLPTAVREIKQNCGQALAAMREANKLLYRGTKDFPGDFFVARTREDRVPKSSPATFQRNIDKALKSAGFGALRSNSIYVTSNESDANAYAISKHIGGVIGDNDYRTLYMVFPKDGFSFTWSPKIDDLYVDEWNLWNKFENGHHKRMQFFYHDDQDDLIPEFLQAAEYTNQDFPAAIASRHEVMISGIYYGINISFQNEPTFNELFL